MSGRAASESGRGQQGVVRPEGRLQRSPTPARASRPSLRPAISAAVIALDEERNLAALLPELDWADEIVVVDGGSRDGTLEVARRHGCRVVARTLDDFAAQRNFALDAARGDWVLSIDADERPTAALRAEIRRRTRGQGPDAFRVPIRSWIFGRRLRRCGVQDDCPVRLVRRGRARWQGRVHERLCVQGRIGCLDGCLFHHTLPDVHAFLAKMHRYTRLEAQSRVEAGTPPQRRGPWLAASRELFRRLFWKHGALDGPHGWAFCALSGLSEWILAREHRRLWLQAR